MLILGVVVAFNESEDPDLLNATATTTTTTTAEPIEVPLVVVPTTQVPATGTPTPTSSATPTTRPGRVTTTAVPPPEDLAQTETKLVCARTTPSDPTPAPDDWAQYWQTKPKPNDALDLVICVEDDSPKVGETVKLYVRSQDPDAEIGAGPCDIAVSWDSNAGSDCRSGVVTPPEEPMPTPAEKAGYMKMTYVHQYDQPGEWVIDVSSWSGPDSADRHPYASFNSIELRLNVHR